MASKNEVTMTYFYNNAQGHNDGQGLHSFVIPAEAFLAHLSRRLIGELIGKVGLHRSSVVCLSVVHTL